MVSKKIYNDKVMYKNGLLLQINHYRDFVWEYTIMNIYEKKNICLFK